MLQKNTIDFLKKLKNNNNKEWLDGHRALFEAAKSDFESLVSAIILQLGKLDSRFADLKLKDCIFRINRDVRFSKDKSPYKTNFGAAFSPGGKKSKSGGFYVHIEPGKSFIGGGVWMPEPSDLKKIRQEIDYNFKAFHNIVTHKQFVALFGQLDQESVLKNPPKGYDAENPAVEYLKLKSFVTGHAVKDPLLTDKELIKTIVTCYKALHPFLQFLNTAINE
jgi:uncharacterized protein (TIGR02453 family)